MSNHSSDHDPQIPVELQETLHRPENSEAVEKMKAAMKDAGPLGATGDFPNGKMTPQDEGAIKFGVGAIDGQVVINFNTPVNWLGMFPEQARTLGKALIDYAHEASDQRTDPA